MSSVLREYLKLIALKAEVLCLNTTGVCLLLSVGIFAANLSCLLAAIDEETTGIDLISDAFAQMPSEPIDLKGDIFCRRRHGTPVKELKFEMQMRLGTPNPSITYTIADVFGRNAETLVVSYDGSGSSAYRYQKADATSDAPLHSLFEPVMDTDLTWFDLTLSFLSWTNATIVGREEIRGRPSYVVRLTPPWTSDISNSAGRQEPYASVLVWVDKKLHFFLQAQGLDAKDNPVRTLWVRSVKKMNDRWMVKDIEVQADPNRRTRLTIREVNATNTGTAETMEATDLLQPESISP